MRRFLIGLVAAMGLVAALALFAAPVSAAPPSDPDRHGEIAHEDTAGTSHGAHDVSLKDINWFYGFAGEKEGVPPSVLWRPPGMPAPFGALLLNAAILYLILFRLLDKPVSEGLKSRKETILRGMDEAARMKSEAEQQLESFEEKLENIDEEIERVRREMRDAGTAERARILAEAKERRARMERDARLLIEQELKAARELLLFEAARSAVSSAESTLTSRITPADQQRLADEYLAGLRQAAVSLRGKV